MTAPVTRAVVKALTADGADVRFVGGCVRDALLGRESADIDIGTPDPPERVMGLLEGAGIETRTVPRGIAHGTVTAIAGGNRYEITTLRRDERTDGRHAEVAFTDDWEQDAARRDFTINAMSVTPDGVLHDYFGGQEDLEAGRVRFVGDPATRIAEDHLRLLRFFRFFAWYGKGEPDEEALDACRAEAHRIQTLSGERVQAEMLKMLKAPTSYRRRTRCESCSPPTTPYRPCARCGTPACFTHCCRRRENQASRPPRRYRAKSLRTQFHQAARLPDLRQRRR